MPILISSLDELKRKANSRDLSCFIILSGAFRSSKDIFYDKEADLWCIYNYIDDTEQNLSSHQLASQTSIIEAIEQKALWLNE